MDFEVRESLNIQVQAYMQKKPDAELNEVHSWIKNDNELLRGTQFNGATLKSFIFYQIKRVRDGNDASKHKGGNGRPRISSNKRTQIKVLALNKEYRSLRCVSKKG